MPLQDYSFSMGLHDAISQKAVIFLHFHINNVIMLKVTVRADCLNFKD
jgi:hypothetical protein